tara:strand:- start:3951 stop:4706 length:756 start_codon:yes stop_codon:yes gene_type:complete
MVDVGFWNTERLSKGTKTRNTTKWKYSVRILKELVSKCDIIILGEVTFTERTEDDLHEYLSDAVGISHEVQLIRTHRHEPCGFAVIYNGLLSEDIEIKPVGKLTKRPYILIKYTHASGFNRPVDYLICGTHALSGQGDGTLEEIDLMLTDIAHYRIAKSILIGDMNYTPDRFDSIRGYSENMAYKESILNLWRYVKPAQTYTHYWSRLDRWNLLDYLWKKANVTATTIALDNLSALKYNLVDHSHIMYSIS